MRNALTPAALLIGLVVAGSSGCAQITYVHKWVTGQNLIDATRDLAVEIRILGPTGPLPPGTGFIVDRKGIIVTSAHVATASARDESGNHVTARIIACFNVGVPTLKCLPARVLKTSVEDDLATLQVNYVFPGAVRIARDRHLDEGEEIFARLGIGNLLGPSLVFGNFTGVADPRRAPDLHITKPLLVLDITANPAGSGGPVFDRKKGELIGVIKFVTGYGGRPDAVAIPAMTLIAFLKLQ